jgi:hypothetical protein
MLGMPHGLSGFCGRKKTFYCQRGIKPDVFTCSICTLVSIPTELPGMTHVRVLLIFILSFILYKVCALYQKLRPFNRTALKVKLNRMIKNKDRFSMGMYKFAEIYTMDDVELG